MAQQYFSRKTLSGASNGAGVLMPNYQNTIASGGSANSGSIRIHSVSSSEYDEIWLYAANVGTAAATLSLWWASTISGGVGVGATTGGLNGNGSEIDYTISQGGGLTLVIPGLILGPGLFLNGSAWSSGASQGTNSSIIVYGFVNHIGPSM